MRQGYGERHSIDGKYKISEHDEQEIHRLRDMVDQLREELRTVKVQLKEEQTQPVKLSYQRVIRRINE